MDKELIEAIQALGRIEGYLLASGTTCSDDIKLILDTLLKDK